MSLNNMPSSERVHISFFGRRNAGKSSLVNAVTGQNLAIVSEVQGTTTDPVYKAMELLPMGPVVIIDTPGIDDEGELGALRVQKTYQALHKTDIAILVTDLPQQLAKEDIALLAEIKSRNIPYIIVHNKADLQTLTLPEGQDEIWVSAATGHNINALKEKIAGLIPGATPQRHLVADLLQPGDFVVLVIPIDSAAPKGRLILPQQQTLRDILEAGAIGLVTRETELTQTLEGLAAPPRLVITDSQAFETVSRDTPAEVLLTSFSILFARYKGNLPLVVKGAAAIDTIQDGDAVLICEGCTHHRQCDDIGTVKLPRWIERYTGKKPSFHFTSGTEFPQDLSPYKMVIHCGGCMLNEKEMQYRQQHTNAANIPITNYGIAIAYMQGILRRSVAPFAEIAALLPQNNS